jgi:chemotaxis protein MotA
VFGRYQKIAKDGAAMEMITDTIRSMIMNFDNAHQVEEMLEKQLDVLHHESLHGAHALQKMADALPALGIVAAVLGVIKTMASIDKPPEVLGQMIGGALVGTFLGVFLSYGVVGPFSDRVKSLRDEEHAFYNLIREALVASLNKHTPHICVEVARRNAPKKLRPSFSDMEEALREVQKAA